MHKVEGLLLVDVLPLEPGVLEDVVDLLLMELELEVVERLVVEGGCRWGQLGGLAVHYKTDRSTKEKQALAGIAKEEEEKAVSILGDLTTKAGERTDRRWVDPRGESEKSGAWREELTGEAGVGLPWCLR